MDSPRIIWKYFSQLTYGQRIKISQLESLYRHWNQYINLISRKDIPHLYERHVLHSLAILDHLPQRTNKQVVDVGTGGGFPGIPLAIACPQMQFHLVDSRRKKIDALKNIIAALNLENCTVHNDRIENLRLPVEIMVCRAVAEANQLLLWTNKLSSIGGLQKILLLKGGDVQDELKDIHQWSASIHSLAERFEEPFFE